MSDSAVPSHVMPPAAGARAGVMQLLRAWSAGDASARDRWSPLTFGELLRQAPHYMVRKDAGQMLQTTALVHAGYLPLVDQREARREICTQFFVVAAELMRRILVEHARAQRAATRSGGATVVARHPAASSTLPATRETIRPRVPRF